jgi:hypothetical protein
MREKRDLVPYEPVAECIRPEQPAYLPPALTPEQTAQLILAAVASGQLPAHVLQQLRLPAPAPPQGVSYPPQPAVQYIPVPVPMPLSAPATYPAPAEGGQVSNANRVRTGDVAQRNHQTVEVNNVVVVQQKQPASDDGCFLFGLRVLAFVLAAIGLLVVVAALVSASQRPKEPIEDLLYRPTPARTAPAYPPPPILPAPPVHRPVPAPVPYPQQPNFGGQRERNYRNG